MFMGSWWTPKAFLQRRRWRCAGWGGGNFLIFSLVGFFCWLLWPWFLKVGWVMNGFAFGFGFWHEKDRRTILQHIHPWTSLEVV